MKLRKGLLSCVLVLVVALVCLLVLPTNANAATENYYTYEVSNGKAKITDVDESISGNVTIPSTLGGYSVTTIGADAFSGCTQLTSITVADSVTVIESSAFGWCWNLSEVIFGNKIKTIGACAFEGCEALQEIVIPDSVTCMDVSVFASCNQLSKITLPFVGEKADGSGATYIGHLFGFESYVEEEMLAEVYGVQFFKNLAVPVKTVVITGGTSIDKNAFTGCQNLTTISIPKSVTSIGKDAFDGCNQLKTVNYDGYMSDADEIEVASGNKLLTKAKWKYKSCIHKYKTTTERATLKKNGSEVKKCSVCGKVSKKTTIYKIKTVKLSTTEYTYNGKKRTPTVTVKDSKGNKLKKGTDYTVTYDSGRKKVGEYEVKVKFKGDYSGTKTLTFEISPKGTTVSKLTAKSKALKVTLKKQTSQTTGYQIQYSTDKDFDSAKKKTLSSNKTTSKTIKSLKKKKKYYVRVRTYKVVDGVKFYSDWSKAKSMKTK